MEGFGYQENWLPFCQSDLGHNVKVLTTDRWFPLPNYDELFKQKYGPRIRKPGLSIDRGVEIIRCKPYFEIASRAVPVFPVSRVVKEFEPDVIHVHGATNFNLPCVLSSAPTKARIFVDCHQDYLVTRHTSIFNRLNYIFWSWYYHNRRDRIAKFLPISEASKRFLVEKLKTKQKHIRISPLGVDLDSKSRDDSLRKSFRAHHSLEKYFIIVNAGKQYEMKNITFIIELYRELLGESVNQDLALVLIGEATGDYEKAIVGEIERTESEFPQAKVLRLPFLPNAELQEAYSAADLGIWPGVASNTIQEAMGCGVVVSLLDTGITTHLIVDNGLLIRELDPPTVASQLKRLISDPNELRRLQQLTHDTIRKFSWNAIAKETLEIYSEEA